MSTEYLMARKAPTLGRNTAGSDPHSSSCLLRYTIRHGNAVANGKTRQTKSSPSTSAPSLEPRILHKNRILD